MTTPVKLAFWVCAISLSGCATGWKPRSETAATIYASTTEIPVLFAVSTFVGAIDGVATERGKGYVLVDPGLRRLTLFNVSCPLPVIAVFCLKSARKNDVQSTVRGGAVYRIGDGLDEIYEVAKDGSPVATLDLKLDLPR